MRKRLLKAFLLLLFVTLPLLVTKIAYAEYACYSMGSGGGACQGRCDPNPPGEDPNKCCCDAQPVYGPYEYQYQGEYNYEYEYEGRYDYEYEYEYQSRYEYENQYSGEDSYDSEYPSELNYPAQESYNNEYSSQSNPCAPDASPHSRPGDCKENYQSQFVRDPLPRYNIEGTVYYDYDESKRQGPDEPGLRRIRVTADGLSRGSSKRDSDASKANGTYRIRGLLEGRYKVEVGSDRNLPKDYRITEKPGNINLQGRDERRVDFGIFIPYTIKGIVFYDYNQTGIQDKHEPGLGGQDSVRVTAERRQSKIDGHDDSKGKKGEYEINNLPEGTYDVNVKNLGKWKDTVKLPLKAEIGPKDAEKAHIGLFQGFNLEGTVYNDMNKNGQKDLYEPGVPNVKVRAYDDRIKVGNNAKSRAGGKYSIKDLPEGNYDVFIHDDTANALWFQEDYQILTPLPIKGVNIQRRDRKDVDIRLFGNYTVSGFVYIDKDQDPQTTYNPSLGDTKWQGTPQISLNGDDKFGLDPEIVKTDNSGNYTIQGIGSDTYQIGFANFPSGYTVIHPQTGPPPQFQATTGRLCAPATPAPGGVCSGPQNRNLIDLNFAIAQSQSWLQGYGLDMRFDQGLTNSMPQQPDQSCGGAFVSAPASGTTPGLVFSGTVLNPRSNFGQGQASAAPYNWLVGDPYQETYSSPTGGILATAYDQVKSKLKRSSIMLTPLQGAVAGCSDLANCTLSNLPQGVYEAPGNVTLNAWTIPANTRYVILVAGTLRINNTIPVPKNQKTSLTFIVKGDIIVASGVGGAPAPTTCPAADVSQLDGFYSTDQSFTIQGTGDCATERMLSMQGSLVVNARRGGGTFQNNRDLCGNNSLVPSFTIRERLDLVLNTPDILKIQNFIYQEVAP